MTCSSKASSTRDRWRTGRDWSPGCGALAETVPLVVDLNLERPALLAPFTEFATAIVADFGCSPAALVDALTGEIPPTGVLPFEIPRSLVAVLASRPDVANDTADPVYPEGAGLRYDSAANEAPGGVGDPVG